MNKLKGHIILLFALLGMFSTPQNLTARPDTTIVVPIPEITANNPVCENSTLKLETPFQDGVIFHWFNTEGTEISVVATATVPDMQLSMAGEYALIAELNGCFSERATINIEVATRPDTPIVTNNGPLCEGDTLRLDGPNLPNTSYKWIDPFGTVISNEEDVIISNIPKELAGDYFLEITQFGCASNLGATTVGIIAINEIPELTISGPACEGDNLFIKGPQIIGANYNWTGPNGFESNDIDSLLFESVTTSLAGEFTLTLEADGCKSPAGTINVEVFAKPTAILSGGGAICEGTNEELSLQLSGTAPFEIIYALDDEPQQTIMTSLNDFKIEIEDDGDGTYSLVSMSDKNGCAATLSGTATVNVLPTPQIRLITDTLCGDNLENYQVKINVISGTQPYNFQGIQGELIDSIFTSELIPSGSAYGFQISDDNNCQTPQITGQHNCGCATNAGTVDLTPITVCGSETVEITHFADEILDGNDQLVFVLHDTPNGLGNILATSLTPSFSFSDELNFNQTYYISPAAANQSDTLIDFDDFCLSVGMGTPITFLPIPTAPIISGTESICPGTALSLAATSLSGAEKYIWETPNEIIETPTAQLLIDPIDADYTGDFRVAVVKDGCASLSSEDFFVIVTIPTGQAVAGDDTISCGNPVFYLDASPPEFGFGSWSESGGGAFIEDIFNPQSKVSSLQEGPNVFHWVLSTEDCPTYESDSVIIFYRPNALAVNDNFILNEEEAVLDLNVLENDVTPEGHTIWVELLNQTHQGVVDQLDEDGNFSYRRFFNEFQGNTVFDYLLCFETPTCPTLCDTGAVSIEVFLDPLDPGVYVPDGITPNNDGVNDRLIIEGIENHEENELLIFDRWGNIVFQASPYKNSWDGSYNNTGLPEGAYYYVLKTDVTNKRTLKGRVYIIR